MSKGKSCFFSNVQSDPELGPLDRTLTLLNLEIFQINPETAEGRMRIADPLGVNNSLKKGSNYKKLQAKYDQEAIEEIRRAGGPERE